MKWFFILGSMIRNLLSSDQPTINPIEELKMAIAQNAIKLVALMIAIVAVGSMFTAGLTIIALDIGAQYDQTGTVFFSSILVAGIILSSISLLVVAIVVNVVNSKSSQVPKHIPLKNIGSAHPVQDAVALLIADFVKEREYKRNYPPAYFDSKISDNPSSSDSRAYFRH